MQEIFVNSGLGPQNNCNSLLILIRFSHEICFAVDVEH